MIIGIQMGLDGIKQSLEKKGYKVMEVNNVHSAPVDVYVYDGHEKQSCIMDYCVPSLSGMVNTVEQRNYQGTFMLDAAHRSIEEIESMIQRRTYSPLF